jgi:hypothetical protein
MRNKILIFFIFTFMFAACSQRRQAEQRVEDDTARVLLSEEEAAFLKQFNNLYGKSFSGKQVFMAEGRESWAHLDFTMHVSKYSEGVVHVPFHLNGDTSRTWMFLAEEEGLRFRHDHRHPDGTPEEVTLYGGYADGLGTAYRQSFPADEYTCRMLPNSCHAVWVAAFSEDLTTFSYMLYNHGELLFQADFDLTEE